MIERRVEDCWTDPNSKHYHGACSRSQRPPLRAKEKYDPTKCRDGKEHSSGDWLHKPLVKSPSTSTECNRFIDDRDLERQEDVQRIAEWPNKCLSNRSNNRLWVSDRESDRREWRTEKRQQNSGRLHRAKVCECDGCTNTKRSDSGCDCSRAVVTQDAPPRDRCLPSCITGYPVQPHATNSRREMSQRDDAGKAQLESRIRCDSRITHNHPSCDDRENGITVPVAAEHGSHRSHDGHQRGTFSTRRWCHDEERDSSTRHDTHGNQSRVTVNHPRKKPNDPTKNGEVEAGDGKYVRKASCAKCILNFCVALAGIAKYERNEHRSNASIAIRVFVIRATDRFAPAFTCDTGEQSRAKVLAERRANSRDPITDWGC